jgi:hypothetical protein
VQTCVALVYVRQLNIIWDPCCLGMPRQETWLAGILTATHFKEYGWYFYTSDLHKHIDNSRIKLSIIMDKSSSSNELVSLLPALGGGVVLNTLFPQLIRLSLGGIGNVWNVNAMMMVRFKKDLWAKCLHPISCPPQLCSSAILTHHTHVHVQHLSHAQRSAVHFGRRLTPGVPLHAKAVAAPKNIATSGHGLHPVVASQIKVCNTPTCHIILGFCLGTRA